MKFNQRSLKKIIMLSHLKSKSMIKIIKINIKKLQKKKLYMNYKNKT